MLAHQAGIDNLNWLSVWSARTVYIFYFEFPTKMIVNKNISSTQKFARNKFKKMRDRKLYLVVISGAFVIPIKSLTAKGSLISKSLSLWLKSPPKGAKSLPWAHSPIEKMLRIVIWHFCLGDLNFLRLYHL